MVGNDIPKVEGEGVSDQRTGADRGAGADQGAGADHTYQAGRRDSTR